MLPTAKDSLISKNQMSFVGIEHSEKRAQFIFSPESFYTDWSSS